MMLGFQSILVHTDAWLLPAHDKIRVMFRHD